MKKITLKDGTEIPVLGQGTWYMGENPAKKEQEIETLRWGIEHDMNLIDTAEMYGEGASEELVGLLFPRFIHGMPAEIIYSNPAGIL